MSETYPNPECQSVKEETDLSNKVLKTITLNSIDTTY